MQHNYFFRLHREALKQAAIDPSTGRIDISILTTGISGQARKQRAERAQVNNRNQNLITYRI